MVDGESQLLDLRLFRVEMKLTRDLHVLARSKP